MHQQIETRAHDIWSLYLAENLQEAADTWPSWRFLGLLFSESTEQIAVTGVSPLGPGAYVELQLEGECHDLPTTVTYKLYKKDLSLDEKKRVLSLVKTAYPRSREAQQTTVRNVARAFGISP